jgi:hypothetical protein
MLDKKYRPNLNNGFDYWEYTTRERKLVARVAYIPSLVLFEVTFPNREYLTATYSNPGAADCYAQKFAARN